MCRLLFVLVLLLVSGCDWFTRGGPPAQQTFQRDEIYAGHFEPGTYRCTKCGAVLFSSEKKVKGNLRWPAFSESAPGSLQPQAELTGEDKGKLVCAKCHLHVGHYCRGGELLDEAGGAPICALSASLKFEAK